MSSSFTNVEQLFLTSESVTEGHPDKMCDQISDSVLDAMLEQDPNSRVACETSTTTALVLVSGEITSRAVVDVPQVVRSTIRRIGYDDPAYGFDADTCAVMVALGKQSADIDLGVSQALETRGPEAQDAEIDATGAGDQGMMFGFACDETPELMPLTASLAQKLTRQLAVVRRDGTLPYLRPDGKSQVTVEYHKGRPKRVQTVVISTQHHPDVSQEQIATDVRAHVIAPVVPKELLDEETRVLVNPTGRFVIGGPMGDTGLTGRKIIVDTYGGVVRHGGGAFSGKDPTKVDRSAAYAMRWIAKNVVYAIGVARPLAIAIETFGTGTVDDNRLLAAIDEVFDLRPGAIIRDLRLRRPIYAATAAYGHFGRTDLDLPWEQTDRVDALRERLDRAPTAV